MDERICYGGELRSFSFEPVFQRFFKRALKDPDRVAIKHRALKLTYGELAQRSLAIASLLRQRGHRQPDRIGVMMDRSVDATSAMLGVLAAGLVYVPLDTRNPEARTRHIVQTSSLKTIVTSDHYRRRVESLEAFALVPADTDSVKLEKSLPIRSRPNDEAYVIYTSGTTGKPKGVVGVHGPFSKQIEAWKQSGFDFLETNGALIASYGFDSSFLEHFLVLDTGGTLTVFEDEDILDTDRMAHLIHANKVNFAIISPALLSGVAGWFENNGLRPFLQCLVSGGEPVPSDHLWRFKKLNPEMDVYVGYGTTEATIAVSIHPVKTDDLLQRHASIGKPLPGYYVFLLDDNFDLVNRGQVGQICIGGDVLARGYDRNDVETSRRFIANPLQNLFRSDDFGEVIYLSGDLARVDESGNLVFMGRMDNQVQMRGLRVELGEIESVMKDITGSEVFVSVYEGEEGDKLIAAYVADSAKVDFKEVVLKLSSALPAYMMPSYLIPIDKFPVNVNDKIDKTALPEPSESHLIARFKDVEYKAASGQGGTGQAVEQIVDIARGVLNIGGDLNENDLFVDLGADSLRIVKLVLDVQRVFSVTLPIKTMNASELSARRLAEMVWTSCSKVPVS